MKDIDRGRLASTVLGALAALTFVAMLFNAGCITKVDDQAATQAAQIIKLEVQVKALQSQVDSSTSQIAALTVENERSSAQLYELSAASDPQQILRNFDSAIAGYEVQLEPRGEEPAIGYAWGNLGDNVFPMLQVMIDGRQIKPAEITKRIDRLERYITVSETTGDNEGAADTTSREYIAKLRKELKGF
jgi:uncharacterized coiled-coil protein SlyX